MADYISDKLKELEIKAPQVAPKDLVVPANQSYIVSPKDPKIAGVKWVKDVGVNVRPKSWAHLKKMIGIPDKAAKNLPRQPEKRVTRLVSAETLKRDSKARKAFTEDATTLAKAYLYGDSSLTAQHESVLSAHYGKFGVWIPLFRDITIEKNATFLVASAVKSLIARDIKIKVGGKLESQSDVLHINCRSMEGGLP